MHADEPIRIGISSCLLGQEVRFDGGHKRDPFLVDILGAYVEWVAVCPEVELGLGTPRPTMRLAAHPAGPRLVVQPARTRTVKSSGHSGPTDTDASTDHTDAMRRFAERRVADLAGKDLSGYVLKRDSPSCGMERVRVYGPRGAPARNGRGLFAQVLLARFPQLPVEEEGRLHDPGLRENFIERIFAYHRLRSLFGGRWRVGDVVSFHTAHKLQLMAHSPRAYRELGHMVGKCKHTGRTEFRQGYGDEFMRALAEMATRGRQVNVLQHMAGYFRRDLDSSSRRELAGVIDDYRSGFVPLIVPITLIRHHAHRLDVPYLLGQTYLQPHPKELMLRNHV